MLESNISSFIWDFYTISFFCTWIAQGRWFLIFNHTKWASFRVGAAAFRIQIDTLFLIFLIMAWLNALVEYDWFWLLSLERNLIRFFAVLCWRFIYLEHIYGLFIVLLAIRIFSWAGIHSDIHWLLIAVSASFYHGWLVFYLRRWTLNNWAVVLARTISIHLKL